MKLTKRIFAAGLALCLLLVLVPAAFAQGTDNRCGVNASWNFDEETKTLTISGTGDTYNFFQSPYVDINTKIEKIIIEDGITYIGEGIFVQCSALKSITISKTVNKINDYAFRSSFEYRTKYIDPIEEIVVSDENTAYCAVDNVLFDKAQTELILYPAGNAATEYTLPDTVRTIRKQAFEGSTALEKVSLNDGLVTIGTSAFEDCTALSEIRLNDGLDTISAEAFEGCTALADVVIPDSVTYIGAKALYGTAFYGDPNNPVSDTLYSGNWLIRVQRSVTDLAAREGTVGFAADCFTYTTKQTIGNKAVCLETISLPASMRVITDGYFSVCPSLTSISVHEDNTLFASQNGILYNKAMTKLLTFPRNLGITSFTVPDTVTEIGAAAFENCENLKYVTLPAGLTEISSDTFSGCDNLTGVQLPEELVTIGSFAFYDCSALTDINLPQGLRTIDSYAFYYCESLESLTLPEELEYIGDYAFYGCSKLDFTELPRSVTRIGGSSTFSLTIPFKNLGDGEYIYIGDCLVLTIPKNPATRLEIRDGTRLIADSTLTYRFSDITELVIPSSLEYIGDNNIKGFDNLEKIICYKTPEQWAELVATGSGNDDIAKAEIVYMPFTESRVTRTADGCTVQTAAYNIPAGKRLLAAGYCDGRLTDAAFCGNTGGTVTLGGDIDTVAVYAWDENFAPYIQTPEIIPKGRFFS